MNLKEFQKLKMNLIVFMEAHIKILMVNSPKIVQFRILRKARTFINKKTPAETGVEKAIVTNENVLRVTDKKQESIPRAFSLKKITN